MQGRSALWLTALLLVQAGGLIAVAPTRPEVVDPRIAWLAETRLVGPFTHDNLTVYLIHGEDQLKNRKLLTLAEALATRKFVVYETQSVNELQMENLSTDEHVVLLSGDILKGGQQDRVVQFDRIVPPKSGKQPLTVFCVEHTAERWRKPLQGEEKTFASSPGYLASNRLRLACRTTGEQGVVWREVSLTQANLAAKVGKSVQDARSTSSLALSLDAKQVIEGSERYVQKLTEALKDQPTAIGYVFAVNDKVVGGDIYGSPALFRKIWPRLLKANAIEAFAEMPKDKKTKAPEVAAFRAFLQDAVSGRSQSQDVGKDIRQETRENRFNYSYESRGSKQGETLRFNFLARDNTLQTTPPDTQRGLRPRGSDR